jgi:hypothetical protein
MSLGVNSLWRARHCIRTVRGLSLIPGDFRGLPLGGRAVFLRYTSTETTERLGRVRAPKALAQSDPNPETINATEVINPSRSSHTRSTLRRVIKQRSRLGPNDSALVRPAAWYPDKHERKRSLRKHKMSAARQDLAAHARAAKDKPNTDWQSVLDFLSKLTPKFGTIFDFKVMVGRGVASEVRAVLSTADTNIWQIQQSTHCLIRLDDVDEEDGALHLTLSGSQHSVRSALIKLLNSVGQLTAIRAMDDESRNMLLAPRQHEKNALSRLRLLEKGETEPDDKSLTLRRETAYSQSLLTPETKYMYYMLTRRADEILRPATWTKSSLENYVGSLVHGVIPPHLAGVLYKRGPDHEETVVSLLVEIFHSEHSRPALSTRALALAISYIQARNFKFRPAARAIFNQVETYNIAMDTRTSNLFLRGSSMTGDLVGFHAVLRLMARKGFYADSEAWLMLLKMVENADAKHTVLRRMKKKGLHRMQSTFIKAGRHMAPYELEKALPLLKEIDTFIDSQDKIYGTEWLDVVTVNRIVDILGRHGKHSMCHQLLYIIFESGRVTPDVVTLNTLISHVRGVDDTIAIVGSLQRRWHTIVLVEDTYDILFRIAWRNRSPNMLRVVWHYACFAQRTSSKMRTRLNALLHKDFDAGRRALLQDWETMIFGTRALTTLRGSLGRYLESRHIAKWYGTQALVWRPAASFVDKLAEAYEMDRSIHARIKNGETMTASTRASLTVKLQLEPRMSDPDLRLAAPEIDEEIDPKTSKDNSLSNEDV